MSDQMMTEPYGVEHAVTNYRFTHLVRNDQRGTRVNLSDFDRDEGGLHDDFTTVAIHVCESADDFDPRVYGDRIAVNLGDTHSTVFLSREQAVLLRRALGEVT